MKRRLLTLTLALLLGSASIVSGEQIQTSLEELKRPAHDGKKHAQALSQQNHKQKATKGNKGAHPVKTLREFHDEARPEDEGRVMEIFYNSYDHLDHSVHEIEQDVDRIKVMSQKSTRKGGRKCQPQDWVTVHWKTYVDTGHKLEDSREFKTKQPAVFEIGMYQAPKCWEIATSYMHAGQQLKVSCPSYLAYGGTPKYGHYDLDLIPADSPLVFELDVLECQAGIDKINEVNKKAKNHAPWVYRHGKHGPRGGPGAGGDDDGAEKPDAEEAAPSKKDMAGIKHKVTKMKKTISEQKKRLKKDEDEAKKMENEIEGGDGKDQEDAAKKMMIKQEKVIKEEKIIKREKKQVKSVKKLIKTAENPKATKRAEDLKNKQKNPEDKPAEKAKDERVVDSDGKPLVPNPPPFDCFYIKYPQKDSKGRHLVLEADTKDKYHPKKTGLYNFFLHPLGNTPEEEAEEEEDGHHANHEVYQQWHYDTTTHKLSIKAFSNKVMFQGNNRNLVLYADKSMKNQVFSFDAKRGVWYNEYSDQGIMIDHASQVEPGANIITAPRKNKKDLARMQWRMVACDEVTDKKKSGGHGGKGHHDEKEKGGDTEDHDDHDHDDDDHDHDHDHDDDKEDKEEDEHHDEDEADEKEEDHAEGGDDTDDEDHDAAKHESDLKKAKEIVKTIVAKTKKEEAHHESSTETQPAGHHSETSTSSGTSTDEPQEEAAEEKAATKRKGASKGIAAAATKKGGKKKQPKKKEVSEEEKQKEVEKDAEEDEKLDQKKPSAAEKASESSSDDEDLDEPAKPTASLHQKSGSSKKLAKKQVKIEKKKQQEKKVEKAEDSDNEEKDEEKPAKKAILVEKKTEKKEKKAKKAKKQKKSEKKHKKAKKSTEEESTDDIMEKFEESLGKDDLGAFESLHQKDSEKDVSAPATASKKSKVKSADSDDFDHEKKMSLKKKQGPQEKKAAKQTEEGLSEDEEDRVLEQKLKDLKKLVNES